MVENVIAYFSLTTKPKVMMFDDGSTSDQFLGQRNSWWVHIINHDKR